MDVSGKGVFLTGGARGIGRGMTEALLAKGAKVLFCDLIADLGKAAEADLQKQYGADNVVFRQCDVTDGDQLKGEKFGAVDICVNNAGIMDERVWEKMLAINTTAQIRGSQLALDHMRRDRGGRGGLIINTVSLAGVFPSYFFPVYNASKHAMIGYTTSWAKNPKMGEMGVKWRCLCPNAVNTNLLVFEENQVYDGDKFLEWIKPRMLEPEEVVEAFMKLIQEEEGDGVIYGVFKGLGGVFKKRRLVDADGESNPIVVD
ncbi:hypothetical protein BaRGS_00037541 [Batillaria attramentaria]|uniref:15-hydroxyprostaglandin dehydrogenase [NAD(+)] n=1 Tax=Batillaria attramentaria TaxID=370345 RepID=A0ABD0J8K2_9CAEN